MFTQSIPAVTNALSGSLSGDALKSLTQALGNCAQPLAHRGAVAFSPSGPDEAGPGYVAGGRWNPQDYLDLLPSQDAAQGVDVPGWNQPGGAGSSNQYGDTFQFPTNQEFALNSYFGGPNIYNAGDQYVANSFSNTLNADTTNSTNLNVTNINGLPVAGPAGPPGDPGVPGPPGQDGGVLIGVFGQNTHLKLDFAQYRVLAGRPFITRFNDLIRLETTTFNIPEGVEFDPDTCTVALVPSPLDTTVITGIRIADPVIRGLNNVFVNALTNARLA